MTSEDGGIVVADIAHDQVLWSLSKVCLLLPSFLVDPFVLMVRNRTTLQDVHGANSAGATSFSIVLVAILKFGVKLAISTMQTSSRQGMIQIRSN